MPVTLPPISRRRFLAASFATGAGLLTGRLRAADEQDLDPDRFALLADTHISGNRDEIARGTNMAANLRQVGREILAGRRLPSSVLIDGDCAYLDGKADDYSVLVELLAPMRQSGLPVHLALGNHDHRERFWQALPPREERAKEIEQRHLTVIRAPRADWFILDSLDATNRTPGVLGEEQAQWLARAVDESPEKPALVMVHHNPDERPMPGGLVDTRALFDVLLPRRQVKALFFGHTHDWKIAKRDGLHLVNLPPVAYVFGEGKPNGWVDFRLNEGGAVLELRCIDANHPQHAQQTELRSRS